MQTMDLREPSIFDHQTFRQCFVDFIYLMSNMKRFLSKRDSSKNLNTTLQ